MSEATSFYRRPGVCPVSTSPEFVPIKNTYAFFTGELWEYYKISLGKTPEGNFLEISVLPTAIAKNGKITFTIGSSRLLSVIQISDKQLLRRKFDVRNSTHLGDSSSPRSSDLPSKSSGDSPTGDPDWISDSESADLLWEDQERELRDFADSKEER